MADITNVEEANSNNKKTEVPTLNDISVEKGSFYFNRSHAEELHENAKLVYENSASTVYSIVGETEVNNETKEVKKIPPYEVAVIDLTSLTDSLVIYNDQSTEDLVNLIEDELKNEYVISQSIKLFIEMGHGDPARLQKARDLFTTNSESAIVFLNKLDELGVQTDLIDKIRKDITKTIVDGNKLFGMESIRSAGLGFDFEKNDESGTT